MSVHAESVTARTAAKGANGAAPPTAAMANVNQKGLAVAAHFNAAAVANMLKLQQTMLEFFTRRIDRNVAAAEAFSKAGNAPEIAELAKDYCMTALSDFSEQSAEMMRRAAAITEETLAATKTDRAA